MSRGCRAAWILLAWAILLCTTRADEGLRLKATWKEKDAKVEVFSPDGRILLASGSEGYQLRDAETGRVLAVLAPKSEPLHGVKFSPDGRLLYAKAYSDRHKPVGVFDLKVWNVATGQVKATFPYISEGINVATDDFAVSADGKTLAFAENSERLPMQVETDKMIISSAASYEFTVFFNTSKGLPRAILWDVPSWKEKARVDGNSPLVFSPDGATLVTGAHDWHDPTATIWDTATGRKRTEFDSGEPWMKPLVFSPDGKYLVIGTWRKQELYELASGRRWPVPSFGNGTEAPTFSRDGRFLFPEGLPHIDPLVQHSSPYYCYDLAELPPKRLELPSGELAIAPDGSRYATVQGKRFAGELLTVVLHDLPSRRKRVSSPCPGWPEPSSRPTGAGLPS